MPEEEVKSLAELIETAVGRKLKPFIILGSIIIGLFSYVAAPMQSQIVSLNKENAELKARVDNTFSSAQTFEHFVSKQQFHFLQKESERFITEAIFNPKMVQDIFRAADHSRAEFLDIRTRSGE